MNKLILIAAFLFIGCGEPTEKATEVETEVNYFCFFNQTYKVTKGDKLKSELVFEDEEVKSCTSDVFYEEIKEDN